LEVLRQSHPSDYFQSVSVSSRVTGTRSTSWHFDVDLAVIGISADPAEPSDWSDPSDRFHTNGSNGANAPGRLSKLNGLGDRRHPALQALDATDSSLVPFE
jgi:hypothetical protein